MTFLEMKATFCRNILELRLQKNLSLEALAQRSGVSLYILQALDKGIMPEEMMADDAIRLAKVFGCKIDELFE
ncbi:MAG: helix-turn-helix transcriptional regulator [Lawsonibacter sp.]|nr:helix-turn-helix transcriptional regulator [Lawsonibacter sp.]